MVNPETNTLVNQKPMSKERLAIFDQAADLFESEQYKTAKGLLLTKIGNMIDEKLKTKKKVQV